MISKEAELPETRDLEAVVRHNRYMQRFRATVRSTFLSLVVVAAAAVVAAGWLPEHAANRPAISMAASRIARMRLVMGLPPLIFLGATALWILAGSKPFLLGS